VLEQYVLVLILAVGDPIREPASLSQCLTAYRGWRYADATGRHYVAYDKVTKQKHRIVEVKCIEQKGAPTS